MTRFCWYIIEVATVVVFENTHIHNNQSLFKGLEVLEDTQSSLTPHLLHGQVQEDEGSSPPHPGTAVDQEGCGQRGRVLLADTTDERDDGHGVVRYSMVRPGCVEHALENLRRHIITEKILLL